MSKDPRLSLLVRAPRENSCRSAGVLWEEAFSSTLVAHRSNVLKGKAREPEKRFGKKRGYNEKPKETCETVKSHGLLVHTRPFPNSLHSSGADQTFLPPILPTLLSYRLMSLSKKTAPKVRARRTQSTLTRIHVESDDCKRKRHWPRFRPLIEWYGTIWSLRRRVYFPPIRIGGYVEPRADPRPFRSIGIVAGPWLGPH